jgi:hypothetical protein
VNAGEVLVRLKTSLPPVTLVCGAGAWPAVLGLLPDHPRAVQVRHLDADAARYIRTTAYIASPSGASCLFLVDLDGAGSTAQNILLKVLEEPPPSAWFVLAAVRPPLETVVSRCQVLPLGGPDQDDDEPDSKVVSAVGSAIRVARTGEPVALAQAVRGWGPQHARQLAVWATETASGRWQCYTEDFAPGVLPGQALRVLTVLAEYAGARTAPQVALEHAFRRRD